MKMPIARFERDTTRQFGTQARVDTHCRSVRLFDRTHRTIDAHANTHVNRG
ncbi:MAG: hypothetical protein ACREU8_00340 [Gammaproteobacteria bacterium]